MLKIPPANTALVGAIRIEQDVIDLLKTGTWSQYLLQPALTMPLTKDRKLYEATAKVLQALGGDWSRKAKATLFEDEDAETAVREACETGLYIDPKKLYQFFPTPLDVATPLIRGHLEIDDDKTYTVLEPSAGMGNLIVALSAYQSQATLKVTAIELDPKHQKTLMNLLVNDAKVQIDPVVIGDFLKLDPAKHTERYDRIFMNPPFTKSQDIKHVRHAYEFLKPGGIMIAIMGAGFTFRSDNTAALFREWLTSRGAGDVGWTKLPPGSFKASGTLCNTVYVVLHKRR